MPQMLVVTYLKVYPLLSERPRPFRGRQQLRALFIKRCFPHGLRDFKESSNQLKGLPLKYGVLYIIPRGSSKDLSLGNQLWALPLIYTKLILHAA